MKDDTILMRRIPGTLVGSPPHMLAPEGYEGAELLAKIPLGETVAVKVMRGRSLRQHRLFWTVLRYVAEASEWGTAERLLVVLKLRLGRYDLMKLPTGMLVPVPDSISFSAMTQDEFQTFMDQSIAIICSEVIPDMDNNRLIAEAQAAMPG